ncbi:Trm112 family protein [Desulfovibrio cuneatus]|uniref:Trm112 family protein n=1 Tax=Desulfovibrio cuneatus TaxID=159728 RepID=UPI0003F9FABD|nr:Trm112 family protein [Desulfovibrio cuneatus]
MDADLLSILACPRCKGPLTLYSGTEGLLCAACQVVYPIVDSIPVLLVEEAIPQAQWDTGKRPGPACKGE